MYGILQVNTSPSGDIMTFYDHVMEWPDAIINVSKNTFNGTAFEQNIPQTSSMYVQVC